MKGIVDEREIEFKPDESLLKGLLAARIKIPTLCYHPALGADGRCGLCLVEVLEKDRWTPRLACQVKPAPEIQVRTSSEHILRMRAISARLLLQHAPFPKQPVYTFLKDLVMAGGLRETQPMAPAGDTSGGKQPVVPGGTMPESQSQSDSGQITSDVSTTQTGCILCGLCVRACAKTGRGGLAFSGKGGELKIVAWAGHEDCGRCGSCIAVCPTGFLDLETRNKILIEW